MKIKKQVVMSQEDFSRLPLLLGEELARGVREFRLELTYGMDRLEDSAIGMMVRAWQAVTRPAP